MKITEMPGVWLGLHTEVWNVFNPVFSVLGNIRRAAELNPVMLLAKEAYPGLSAPHMKKDLGL